MRHRHSAALRCRAGRSAFVLVRAGLEGVHHDQRGEARLRHGVLGHRYECLEPDLGAARRRQSQAGKRRRRAWSRGRGQTQREKDYIDAIAAFYTDYKKLSHQARAAAYMRQMEQVAQRYADDSEARIFYALSLLATADGLDKTYKNQLQAGAILEQIFAEKPEHPDLRDGGAACDPYVVSHLRVAWPLEGYDRIEQRR